MTLIGAEAAGEKSHGMQCRNMLSCFSWQGNAATAHPCSKGVVLQRINSSMHELWIGAKALLPCMRSHNEGPSNSPAGLAHVFCPCPKAAY